MRLKGGRLHMAAITFVVGVPTLFLSPSPPNKQDNSTLDIDVVRHLHVPVEESSTDHLSPVPAGVRLNQLQEEDPV